MKFWEACLLELLDGTLVDTTALVDKVTSLSCCQLPDLDCTRARMSVKTAPRSVGKLGGITYGGRLARVDVSVVGLVSEQMDRCEIDGEARTPVAQS